MEFEREEVDLIRNILEDGARQEKLKKYIEELEKANWNNIGGMQNMYANEKAFEEHRQFVINTQKEELEKIDRLLERIYEEI